MPVLPGSSPLQLCLIIEQLHLAKSYRCRQCYNWNFHQSLPLKLTSARARTDSERCACLQLLAMVPIVLLQESGMLRALNWGMEQLIHRVLQDSAVFPESCHHEHSAANNLTLPSHSPQSSRVKSACKLTMSYNNIYNFETLVFIEVSAYPFWHPEQRPRRPHPQRVDPCQHP